MPAIQRSLVVRDDGNESTLTPTMVKLIIALLSLLVFALFCVGLLFVLRRVRRRRNASSRRTGSISEEPLTPRNPRGLSIQAAPYGRESVYVIQEKQNLMASSNSPPQSPVPEIRITLPDELDKQGKRQSGRVVVVRVGDKPNSVGMAPVNDKENLPPYQQSDADRYQSLDLERIGGLKEIGGEKRWS
ncbi:hypothetical protein P152DRAFT_475037 [Eremomyces bilateralis CBS 781.70]|uniref:Uncharacterized protein n=1 Tax=Eremomyces bilateralis CBS 781.70 TaxID=1392243 RepID=A0A6G1FYM7_9PEZI|nr:uncharacterized protein P152DRAFT_475037 [Eremomyces bilateralis CBS 781.70]KAF1810975.1 hypothetical protein P152DRAFT_475037 [Eremomyces bilateralis CBS 781.70]